jgi:hypothetical protein
VKSLVLLGAFLLTTVAAFPVTFNIGLDGVRDGSGNYVPMSTLVLVLVDTTGNGFGSTAAAGDSTTLGSAFGGSDDLIVWRGDFAGGDDGAFLDSINFNSGTGLIPANSSIAIVWLPTLTTASFNLVSGASYGLYTSTAATQFGSTAAWTTGASNSAVYTLNVFTATNTGLIADNQLYPDRLADSVLTANATVVPEPAELAGIFGALALAAAFVRRRRVG